MRVYSWSMQVIAVVSRVVYGTDVMVSVAKKLDIPIKLLFVQYKTISNFVHVMRNSSALFSIAQMYGMLMHAG